LKQEDTKTVRLAVIVTLACLMFGLLVYLSLPAISEFFTSIFGAGLSVKEAAPYAFGTTILVFILFAIAAGDGLLGELQYMLGAFGLFFFFLWMGIAWVF
jgi:hypothetical protein